jgi:hypothetical protein
MSDEIVLRIGIKAYRRLSYMIGRAEEANMIAEAARLGAISAEKGIREVLSMMADQQNIVLPDGYAVRLDDDTGDVIITPKKPEGFPAELAKLMNGSKE